MGEGQQVPGPVRGARALWFAAIGAGVFETALVVAAGRVEDGAVTGVAVRAVVFVAAALVVQRMVAGRGGWARWALLLTLGVLGTLSMVVSPLLWVARGGLPVAVIQESGVVDLLFGLSRVVHVTAVIGACILMFTPAAGEHFRDRRSPALTDDRSQLP
ncbi:MAG TPA: hypothetical protein VN408_35105 [Actinoplanes sp.]|nr:hypothetical protein [Actinoplanes sp.]